MEDKKKGLVPLFIPICIETFCYMLAGMVDTLMLAYVGDEAVGAIGTVNTYLGIFVIMFSVISSGMLAVMTQYIGAGKKGVAYQARQLGLAFNSIIGVIMSIILGIFGENILDVIEVAPNLMLNAKTYIQIVGGFCVLNAVIPIFSSYLRAFGHTKQPLCASIIGNIVNLVLNAVFLYVLDFGVAGVAIATVISRVVNLLIVMIAGKAIVDAKADSERIKNYEVFIKIIKVGLPAACETALYNVAMTFIMRFLNMMDVEGINVTARSYAVNITNFSYCVGAALAQANAIITGWRIGAKEYDKCDKETKKAAMLGIIVAVFIETLLTLLSGFIMGMFTDNSEIITLVGQLLAIDIVLEVGRVSNLVFGNALKTSGDAIFPTVIAAIFMYIFAVGGTYFFGIHLGLMAVGAYIGMALDECVRAIGMFGRWQSGKWREKSLVGE